MRLPPRTVDSSRTRWRTWGEYHRVISQESFRRFLQGDADGCEGAGRHGDGLLSLGDAASSDFLRLTSDRARLVKLHVPGLAGDKREREEAPVGGRHFANDLPVDRLLRVREVVDSIEDLPGTRLDDVVGVAADGFDPVDGPHKCPGRARILVSVRPLSPVVPDGKQRRPRHGDRNDGRRRRGRRERGCPPSPLRPGRPSVTFLPLAEAVGVENPDLTVGLDLLQRDAGNVVALFPALPDPGPECSAWRSRHPAAGRARGRAGSWVRSNASLSGLRDDGTDTAHEVHRTQ